MVDGTFTHQDVEMICRACRSAELGWSWMIEDWWWRCSRVNEKFSSVEGAKSSSGNYRDNFCSEKEQVETEK